MLLPESWKFLLVEFGILDARVQNTAQGIWYPRSTDMTLINPVTTHLNTQWCVILKVPNRVLQYRDRYPKFLTIP